jgi:hypothetical protein
MDAALILSSLGGIVAFVTGVALVIRAILKNVNATRDNTKALEELIKTVTLLRESDDNQNVRLAVLEDRIIRR